MRLHILVEGRSEAALLEGWLRRFLPAHHVPLVIPHRGKGRLPKRPEQPPLPRHEGLLDQLPAKLRAYGRALNPATDRVLVLVDLDEESCLDLKQRLVALLDSCEPRPMVLFRIAIEETESFYLGDRKAIRQAFPQAKLQKLDSYEPDSICGAAELFQAVIGAEQVDKRGWAERMAPHLGIRWKGREANESPSFRQFCQGLLQLAGEPVD